MTSLLDLFGLKSKKQHRSDDIFLDVVKSYTDIWSELFTNQGILVCPASSSLTEESITRDYVMSHIIVNDRKVGDFQNIFDQKLQLIGNTFVTGFGFPEERKVKIISVETVYDDKNQSISIYRVSRPFFGGIASPEEPEEVTTSLITKFVLMVRSFPEAESVFLSIDKYIQELKFIGQQSVDGYSQISPSLRQSLEVHWSKATDKVSNNATVISGLGLDTTTTKSIIGQVIESYIYISVGPFIYDWLSRTLILENGKFLSCACTLQTLTLTDLFIRPEFHCSQMEASKILKTLSEAITPMDKLIILKKTVTKIRESVDFNVHSKYLNNDFELATDDIVSFVIWVIIKTSKSYENIYLDVHYASEYHFVSSSKSDIGFCLNHFQVAISWILNYGVQRESILTSDPLQGTNHDADGFGLSVHVRDAICTKASQAIESFLLVESCNSILELSNNQISFLPNDIRDGYAIDDSLKLNSVAVAEPFITPTSIMTIDIPFDDTRAGHTIMIFNRSSQAPETIQIQSEETKKLVSLYSINAGPGYYTAIDKSKKVYTWGLQDCGRLGHNVSQELDTFLPISIPMHLASLGTETRIRQVSCGKLHMLAVTMNGEVYAWGDNRCAQLGISGRQEKELSGFSSHMTKMASVMATAPMLVDAMKHERVISVACGAYHSLCLTYNGAIYSWGRAANGRLGQFHERQVQEHAIGKPALVRGPWMSLSLLPSSQKQTRLANVVLSSLDSLGIKRVQSMSNQTNFDTATDHPSVTNVVTAVKIYAGFNHSIAITSQGVVYTWGCGTHGRLGHGSHADEYIPRQVVAFKQQGLEVVSAACGHGHSMFLLKEGALFGCGLNKFNQVGASEISLCRSTYSFDRDCILVPQPVLIGTSAKETKAKFSSSMILVERVTCGDYHTAVLTNDKRLFAWGKNYCSSEGEQAIHMDMTSLLPSSPKQVIAAGAETMVLM